MVLLHITPNDDWTAAMDAGEYRATSLTTEGFIHLSTPDQILRTANTFFRGQTGLVLLVIESSQLVAPLRFEDVPEHGTFPHLYGPLNLDALTDILPFEPQDDGRFTLPEVLTDA